MFDKILENLDDVAGKLGLPADQLKSLTESLMAKAGEGGFQIETLMAAAKEHGLPMEKLQEMAGSMGFDPQEMMGKLGSLFGGDSAGGLGGLADAAKGLFGKD